LVDDDDFVRRTLAARLQEEGYEILEAPSAAACRASLEHTSPSLVLLDCRLPDGDGLTLLREIKQQHPDIAVVLLTGYGSIATAVRAIHEGAYHYLCKPLDLEQIVVVVTRALEATELRREVRDIRRVRRSEADLDQLVGRSPAIGHVKQLIQKFASSPASTVLVTGESGTGKDLVAQAIHVRSERSSKPFTNITCTALPEALLESELFGHERGAFTGAHQQKKGLLELSHGGTIFLDEIGEMSPTLQAKLLRFLEQKTFRRVGGTRDLTPDVRVVAATNRELKEAVRAGEFREDLFYRLSVLHVHLPPLRARSVDVPVLSAHFIERFNREFHKNVAGINGPTVSRLCAHRWPGNVRELRNAVERAVLLAECDILDAGDFELLAGEVTSTPGVEFELPADGIAIKQLERSLLMQALARTGGNRTRAARLLGLNRDQVRYRLAKLDDEEAPPIRRGGATS
jgi:DNA-binding NtrC family response regulator